MELRAQDTRTSRSEVCSVWDAPWSLEGLEDLQVIEYGKTS